MLAMVYWLMNVDVKRYDEFRYSKPEKYSELVRKSCNSADFLISSKI